MYQKHQTHELQVCAVNCLIKKISLVSTKPNQNLMLNGLQIERVGKDDDVWCILNRMN